MDELEKLYQFADPTRLFRICEEKLKKLGAEAFLKSPLPEAHKAKEAFFAYFFILALKAATKRDYWLYQPDGFPDLKLISFADTIDGLDAHEFELVTIVPDCASFAEAKSIVQQKFKKGYSLTDEKLLVFINHKSAETWVRRLGEEVAGESPFKELWTCHLNYKSDGGAIKLSIAHRLAPKPVVHFIADTDDLSIFRPNPLPAALEEIELDGRKYLAIKKEFTNTLRKRVMKKKMGK